MLKALKHGSSMSNTMAYLSLLYLMKSSWKGSTSNQPHCGINFTCYMHGMVPYSTNGARDYVQYVHLSYVPKKWNYWPCVLKLGNLM